MKKGLLFFLLIAGALVLLGVQSYNGLVKLNEGVGKSWADVQNQYQRRLDLIDNLVSTVKGATQHESSTLQAVVEARAKATQMTLSVDNLDEQSIKKYQQVQGELGSALSRLMMITENYPDLKANQNFLELQAQIEGTENRIATERRKFNEASRAFNTKVRSFPTVLFAGILNFHPKAYFDADEAAQTAPKVEF